MAYYDMVLLWDDSWDYGPKDNATGGDAPGTDAPGADGGASATGGGTPTPPGPGNVWWMYATGTWRVPETAPAPAAGEDSEEHLAPAMEEEQEAPGVAPVPEIAEGAP